ncbi:MAG TPA: pyridoxal phosphate-dependent aminotransferase [Candidatus Sulfotelmatobacter sp.]|nr:pyridoxal phosphate-dependent aminotransferase [Candidatus Sulfotelmatobacter sp.]
MHSNVLNGVMFAERTNWNLAPNRLSEALATHLAAGKRLYDLSASNPTEVGFTVNAEALMHALQNPATLTYVPDPKGIVRARQAVAEYYADRDDEISAEDVILTASTSEAYSFVFRAMCNPGDELLVPAPSYPLFGFLADIHDVRLAHYPLVYDHGWQIDFHALEGAITPRTRGIIVVNPNNPTGHYVKPEALATLNEICSSRDLALIADEVFLDFAHETNGVRRDVLKAPRPPRPGGEKKPPSLATNNGALTFTMSGLSKISGLPQMKAAWLVTSGPEALKKQALDRIEVIADTYLSMNAPIQLALPSFLDQRHSFQKQVLTRVKRNLGELDRQLMVRKSCSRLEIEGGWYAIVRVPATRTDDELAVDLLTKRGIYVHPGHFYDFAKDGHLIVSLIMPEREFAEGCRQMLGMF